MSWFGEKVDSFLAAVFIAVFGIAGSQGQAFAVQYIQRLGGHLDEARDHLADVQTGLRYRVMGDTVRGELEAEAKGRVAVLDLAYTKVKGANVLTRPIAILRYGEPSILAGTERDFVPALPGSRDGIIYTVFGMIAGFVLYEILRLPVMAILRAPPRRKFRKRG
jgi:hypothetical protein